MTTIDPSDHSDAAQGDRWRLLVAMLVFAAGVSFFQTWSLVAFAVEHDVTALPDDAALFMAGFTFVSIVAYALGFMLLTCLLDLWSGRTPQPLAALNLALPALATFELIKMPLLTAALSVWFWVAART